MVHAFHMAAVLQLLGNNDVTYFYIVSHLNKVTYIYIFSQNLHCGGMPHAGASHTVKLYSFINQLSLIQGLIQGDGVHD